MIQVQGVKWNWLLRNTIEVPFSSPCRGGIYNTFEAFTNKFLYFHSHIREPVVHFQLITTFVNTLMTDLLMNESDNILYHFGRQIKEILIFLQLPINYSFRHHIVGQLGALQLLFSFTNNRVSILRHLQAKVNIVRFGHSDRLAASTVPFPAISEVQILLLLVILFVVGTSEYRIAVLPSVFSVLVVQWQRLKVSTRPIELPPLCSMV